jgi:hypothetical protein
MPAADGNGVGGFTLGFLDAEFGILLTLATSG